MELVSFAKEVLQNAAEGVASYRIGQDILRYLDRGLWVIEKSARWAVPPPLDQDERPQPELIRPLPWMFFLVLLITLRVLRESISLVNLALGKPPVRSADMVTYVQGKRRYLRTLKYQGSRAMRARSSPHNAYRSLRSLLDYTMCFRRQQYGNNNTTLSNNDEVLIVKPGKQRKETASMACANETTMERLIEKMMVDVDADSDDSHSYTLTNVTSVRSDKSDYTDSEHEIAFQQDSGNLQTTENETGNFSQRNNIATSTPEKNYHETGIGASKNYSTIKSELNSNNCSKEATLNFIQQESYSQKNLSQHKIYTNGRTPKGSPKKESDWKTIKIPPVIKHYLLPIRNTYNNKQHIGVGY